MAPSRRPKGKSGKAGKKESVLANEQAALLAQQRAVQQEIEQLQRTIDEAPKREAERRRQQNEAYLAGPHGPRAHYRHMATIAGTRYMESPTMARPKKRSKPAVLRRERAEGRIQTVALIIALVIAIGWLASRYL